MTLPHLDHVPPLALKARSYSLIPRAVALELRLPKVEPRFGHAGQFAFGIWMLMPETSMYEHRDAPTSKD